MVWTISILTIVAFYSMIVKIRQDGDLFKIIKKVEISLKTLFKRKTENKQLEHCSANKILPKVVKLTLYDVTTENEKETGTFEMSHFYGKSQKVQRTKSD